MNVASAYDQWAEQYDSNQNKTRDLEAVSLREILEPLSFANCLEIGCGTGKNTEWLITKATKIISVDLSEEMLAKAKQKISSDKVSFIQADIHQDWIFSKGQQFDLAVLSLVLEHIEDLDPVFERLSKIVAPGGHVYIGELHPFKQYSGTKARFQTEAGTQVVTCFNHHASDFTAAAKQQGFNIVRLQEYFDDNDRNNIPRILTLLFQKAL